MAKAKPFRIVTECDPEANACYIELSKKPVTKSVKQEDAETKLEYVLDYDSEGELVGIEILNMAKAAVLGLFGIKQLLGQKQLA